MPLRVRRQRGDPCSEKVGSHPRHIEAASSERMLAMKRRCLLAATVALLCTFARPALSDEIVKVWESIPRTTRSVSVNPKDGSCWTASGASVLRIRSDGSQAVLSTNSSVPQRPQSGLTGSRHAQ